MHRRLPIISTPGPLFYDPVINNDQCISNQTLRHEPISPVYPSFGSLIFRRNTKAGSYASSI